jgi:ribosomal protein L12E/L44/L45/RPP1/RPP2
MTDLIGSPRAEYVGGRMEPIDRSSVTLDAVSSYPPAPPAVEGDGEAYVTALDTESEILQSDEDESVSLDLETEGTEVPEDIVYELGVAAATHGREFDGRVFAELLEQGGLITDVRLMIAIAVLRTGQKLNGDRMLRVLEEMGFVGEATAARLARDELSKVKVEVVVETTSTDGAVVAAAAAATVDVGSEGEPS